MLQLRKSMTCSVVYRRQGPWESPHLCAISPVSLNGSWLWEHPADRNAADTAWCAVSPSLSTSPAAPFCEWLLPSIVPVPARLGCHHFFLVSLGLHSNDFALGYLSSLLIHLTWPPILSIAPLLVLHPSLAKHPLCVLLRPH